MSFTAWYYPFFLLLVATAYWRLPQRGRILLLLAASYVFYGVWDIRFLSLVMASTLSDYFSANAIAGNRRPAWQVAAGALLPVAWFGAVQLLGIYPNPLPAAYLLIAAAASLAFIAVYLWLWKLPEARRRKGFLLLSITSNLSVLFFFKYFGFFVGSAKALLEAAGLGAHFNIVDILLPVGISFYTFQSIAYIVDVYKGQSHACRDLPTFAAFISFFPQLVAGPIERARNLLPQFETARTFEVDHIHAGARLVLVGYFKKVFVANNCAIVADYVFNTPGSLSGWWVLLGTLAFAFQIYGDFSGYTDIARGSARMFGITLSRNFIFPYSARGPSDFWQRWHISLSSWFRDYLYIPLGGNRLGPTRTLVNLQITMLLSGLWHGATWMFVLWGAWHAAVLTAYRLTPALQRLESASGARRHGAVALMFTFTLLGWMIFRSPDWATLSMRLAGFGHWSMQDAPALKGTLVWLLIHILPLLLLQYASRREQDEAALTHRPGWLRGVDYSVMFLMISSAAVIDVEFIYFQF